jgi:myo-inositol 2-dehydrogenase/D-chiro-inositol 1-dehydrogenase
MAEIVNRLVKGDRWQVKYGPVPTLRIAVIGCGSIAYNQHIPAIQTEVPNLKIVALCERDEKRLRSALDTFGVPWGTTDYQELLARPEIEAVCIATGTDTLVDLAKSALAHGKHVFVEKPMASSVAEATALVPALQSATGKFQVGFNRRFAYGYRQVKELIAGGRLGEPLSIHLRFWFSPPLDPRNIVDDLLLHVGIHVFDLCQYFLGRADTTSVSARLKVDHGQGSLSVLFNYASGSVGTILLSSAGTWLYPGERVEIVGTEAIAIVENMYQVRVLEKDGSARVKEPSFSSHWISSKELSGFSPQLHDFASCILQDRTPLVGYINGIEALQLSERVRQAIS